ncbi:ribose 5-phosphate isomerase A [Guptibacillus hwajinpoensis]|uniref:ribose 5-phosphate isomerase A n=1 Tax=Guptibacillus hwajinpoensis TaxID=208199 RepID=UPI001CFD6D89|nr:ribose 5-phosphate isomerase A [Pseudalkalibacillus hwajinpoensis]WLR60983.1 ribose 5-phosphate isomerase A [Pseudalkalibacillus hwajinpoensis]
MNVKQKCAKAALAYITDETIIGLGGGSTIGYLIDFIKEEKLNVKVVTPSLKTKHLCVNQGLEVLPTSTVDEVDVAFDGCDEVDEKLHALKSGGGIHTQEKLIAKMAKEYILLVDESKVVPELTYKHPVVLEILQDSLAFVLKKVGEMDGKAEVRSSSAKDGYTVSDYGNFLVDVWFEAGWDGVQLETNLKKIPGVLDVSLFTTEVSKALVANEEGIYEISK